MGRIAIVLVALLAGCRKQETAPAASTQPAPAALQPSAAGAPPIAQALRRVLPPGVVEPPSLPEDPVAAARSTAQWREHLEHEEEERQMFYDRPRLAQHRAIVRTLKQIRARYDKAKTERALEQARQDASRALEDVTKRVQALDPEGVHSRLLPDYEALRTAFTNDYPDARLAAVRGDAAAFTKARENVDPRFRTIEQWLEEAADEAGEEERETDRGKLRERATERESAR
jgi:hypothetical protein